MRPLVVRTAVAPAASEEHHQALTVPGSNSLPIQVKMNISAPGKAELAAGDLERPEDEKRAECTSPAALQAGVALSPDPVDIELPCNDEF